MQLHYCYWHLDKKIGSWPHQYEKPDIDQPPAMMKRRLTLLGRQAIEALYNTIQTVPDISWVIAGQHADTSRKRRLLTNLAKKEALSPTDFSLSVHNAIIGLFSIATKNKNMHTAITSAETSFTAGLLEAFALQKDQKSAVGYLYYDTLLPQPFIDIHEINHPTICLALILDEDKPTGQIQMHYLPDAQALVETDTHKIAALIDYLNNHEKNLQIPMPGANMLLERIAP